jgi:hypothetical protein
MIWEEEQQKKGLKKIKMALTSTPDLGLPDVMKPSCQYVNERPGTAVEILTQLLGSWHHLVCYFYQSNLMMMRDPRW